MRSVIGYLVSACLMLGLGACTYGHRAFRPALAPSATHELAVVEFKDDGEPWDPDQVQHAVQLVSERSNQENTIVLVYVHGWHHNAREEDSNLMGLRTSSNDLALKLAGKPYPEARFRLTGDANVHIIGVYVGWRGRSLPMPLDYLTFWGRKHAAETIGQNGVAKFMDQLQIIYEERNTPKRKKFMGMVAVGHSFGGQALFTATERPLMESLAQSPEENVRGYGDLTVLINPALEALQFEAMHRLGLRGRYSCEQTPALFVVSGQGDIARQFWFPKGRWLTPGTTNDPLSLHALGEYKAHRTHSLQLTTNPDSYSVADFQDRALVMKSDFTAPITLGGAELVPLPGATRVPYSPFVVAYTNEELIQGHSGIFTTTFHDFLLNYVAFLEGKIKLSRTGFPCAATPSA